MVIVGNSKFWTDNNILYCQFRSREVNYKIDVDKIELFIKVIDRLCNGKPMPFLIDLRNAQGALTRESANLLSNSPILKKLRISEAYLINSIGVRLVINSYKRIYEPTTPFVVFNDLESAKEYCLDARSRY
ncbi:hypothetical protein Q4509_06435 [Oceanihabitans sp. 1_MG-2023]|uniref:DUF7793 family protein n=1 Tax=Flavobacteriaceae TaxID=49546 RepID=UPI001C0A211B|nr:MULTISPECIES: hypothetical protein [Flavobacteriaceae]MDO6622489.1 hypothetical protein [Oceanihabitans sp. 1_MG-2023]